MNLSTELLIGIILIVLGLLLAAVAYLVLSSRGDDQAKASEELEGDDTAEEGDMGLPGLGEVEEEEIAADPTAELDEGIPVVADSTQVEASSSLEEDPVNKSFEPDVKDDLPESESAPPVDPDIPEAVPSVPQAGPRIQVASLLRDEVTGELIIQVGDREYRSAEALRDSQDWIRVEYAASDLSKWIEMPMRRPTPERDVESSDPYKPMSMIEQINEILQQKVAASGKSQLAVRLMEGPEGSARVLIGVHSYELGEVPDESISDLIREAVADWEAGR
jgi:hypothetical protein